MKKKTMKLMAMLLAAIMAVTPASTAYAAPGSTVTDVVEVVETEVTEEVTETETSDVVTEVETTTEYVETVESEEIVEATTEVISEERTEVVESEEVTTEEVTTEEVATEETTTEDSVSEIDAEVVFPGMGEGYVLTDSQKASKKALEDSVDELENMEEGEHYIAGEVIYSTDSAEEAKAVAEAYGGTLDSYFDGVAVIKLAKGVTVRRAIRAALSDKVVLPPVYPNYYREEYTEDLDTDVEPAAYGTSDPYLNTTSPYYQWQHYAVGSMYAWYAGYTGKGIKVAVIDSGVQASHPDLKANVVYNYNAISGTTSNTDDTTSGHGTHVAGIIAASANSVGGRGIAPEAKIYNIRVFQDGQEESGSSATVARAVNHATQQGVDVINMSLGGYGYTEDERMAVANAKNAGIAVFVAAGNDGAKAQCYPAAFPESICVAAVDKSNGRAIFSNYGSWVDLAGPGVDIYSTYPTGLGSKTGYTFMSGTSQATPVIAGAAAVILSANPKTLQGKTGATKVNALVKLMQTGATKATGGAMGKGVVNLPKALNIPGVAAKPAKPTINHATLGTNGGIIYEANVTTTISTSIDCDLYYSTDGKNPALKNGQVINAQKANGTSQTITVNGIVNGKATGKVTVKAMAVNKYTMTAGPVASVTYTMKPAVSSVSVTGATNQLPVGESLKLAATVTPAYAANKAVTWSINAAEETGVTISTSGIVKASRNATPGTYTVTATPKDGKGGTPGTYRVEVTAAAQIKSIAFSTNSVTLQMKSAAVTHNLADSMTAMRVDGTKAVASDFIWSSSKPGVATVNKTTGVVKTVGAGSTIITALAADGSGVKKTCTVKVEQLVNKITITQPVNTENTTVVNLAAGKSVVLKATVLPTTAKQKSLTWTISGNPIETGVSIKNGKVSAKSTATPGQYTVTATATDGSGTQDTIRVQVYSKAAKNVKLSENSITIFRVATEQKAATYKAITVTTEGEQGYSADYTVTSSNPNVVSVSKSGTTITVKATGKATGSSTITVAMNDGSGKKASCKVTVKNPVSNLSIAPEAGRTGDLGKGKTLKLSAVYEEEFGIATKKVNWSVVEGDKVVKVDKNGKVTALQGLDAYGYTGYAVVQAEVADGSGVKATYEIYTYETVKSIHLPSDKEWNAVLAGRGGVPIDVTFNADNRNPAGYSYRQVGVYPEISIEVSDPSIAWINNSYAYGQFILYVDDVPGKKVTVTVKAMDGSGKSAKKTIYIVDPSEYGY